jgi:hypothetical protein
MLDPDPDEMNADPQPCLHLCCASTVFDVTMVMRIQERKAQIARTAYFTVPIVSATVGWMGALEIAKKVWWHPLPFLLSEFNFCYAHCCGSGMFIPDPDPDFYLSRIPDPKTVTKERG